MDAGKKFNATAINKALLLKVMKVADIFEATILGDNIERPVSLVGVDGRKYSLTKQELVQNFTSLTGNKIAMISLKKNKQYFVAKLQQTPCYAVKIPRKSANSIEMPDGRLLTAGKVIVVNENKIDLSNSLVDISSGTVMSEALFRKTCVLKEVSPELEKRLAEANLLNGAIERVTHETPAASVQEPVFTPMEPTTPIPTPTNNTRPANMTQPQNNTAMKGTLIAAIKSYATDQIFAFNVLADGRVLQLPTSQVIALCDMDMIANATAVTNANGKKFLRGVGIRLEDLPAEYGYEQ